MSRWIDAEWLLNFFEPYPNDYQTPLGSLRACIDDAPTIEIIRCGECKYWKSTVQMPNGTEVKCLYGRKADDFCSYGSRSEKPNNCEHITEDGVTCAKYPACDDCPDNPLNKVKGSKRLLKGSEQTDLVKESPSLVKDLVNAFCEDGTWLERQGVYTLTLAEAKQRAVDIIEAVSRKDTADTPQTDCGWGEPR